MPTNDAPLPDHGPAWPSLPLAPWEPTRATLHLWTQIVGKVRLALASPVNHSWHSTLYVSARGLTTALVPHGRCGLELEFDFRAHALTIRCADGRERHVPLRPRSVADFYEEVMARLAEVGHAVPIHGSPNEVQDPIPFAEDRIHESYDAEAVERFWTALRLAAGAFGEFRGRFRGKSSPVHFFWGSFDLAVTRFSGRRAPRHPGGLPHLPDRVTREAYSHELHSAGWWPGDARFPEPAFYAYGYPFPAGLAAASIAPEGARFEEALSEFVLPWKAVRESADPERRVLAFAESSYRAVAEAGDWDREALEWPAEERER